MKKIVFALLLLCALGFASPVIAQEVVAKPYTCDLATIQKVIDVYIKGLEDLKANKSTDPVNISKVLQILSNNSNTLRAACDELAFSGSKQLVIGPVTIPAGIYRAKATTIGYMGVVIDAISGECGVGTRMSSIHLFNISKGEGNDGAEAVFVSENCSALITVDNVREDWQLSFERITPE